MASQFYTILPLRDATSRVVPETWREAAHRGWPIAFILLAAFAIRCVTFGNPLLEFDEQLYLLVGDRMLHGQLPYVDLWDRKPIGLFLFYAAIRMLGGTGILQYQIVASVCAGATACFVWAMARRWSGNAGAIVAAVCYLLWLNPYHGTGGQSPVIYNILTAIAAWATFRSNDTDDGRRIFRLALLAMAMSGLAIQFKYTPAVEGAFFGCYFLFRLHRTGSSTGQLAGAAAAMIGVALLPTAAAIAFYAVTGHLDSFVQANFQSVFHRNPFPPRTRMIQQRITFLLAMPLLAVAPFAVLKRWRLRATLDPRDSALLIGWMLAAIVGFGMLGDFYDFYFITVLLPMFVLVSILASSHRAGFAVTCALILWPIVTAPPEMRERAESRRAAAALTAAIKPYVAGHCLYVYDGPAILYLLTDACAPSRYIYPDHLTNPIEAPALGVDPATEEARLLSTHPGAIVTADRPVVERVNPDTQRLVHEALARDYVLTARVPTAERTFYVFALRSLHPGPGPIHDHRAANPA